MSLEVFPVFNPPVPAVSFEGDGKLLLQEHEVLDQIADALNLTPFSGFGDNREVPEDFDGDPDELLGEWDEWFPIDEGLKTIEGLIHAIDGGIEMAAELTEPDYVLSDLQDLANCLRIAGENDARFRLEIA